MNYIKHLSGFFEKIQHDRAIASSQLAIYMALFQCWNKQRFENPIVVIRDEVMRLSKVTSRGTYHRSLKLLDELGYIRYLPSYNPLMGSEVYFFAFDQGSGVGNSSKDGGQLVGRCSFSGQVNEHVNDQVMDRVVDQVNNQVTEPIIQTNQHQTINLVNGSDSSIAPTVSKKKRSSVVFEIPSLEEVEAYFRLKGFSVHEAAKFFYYFESNGWLVGGRTKMKNWKAAASHWQLNAKSYGFSHATHGHRPLDTSSEKRYDEPL